MNYLSIDSPLTKQLEDKPHGWIQFKGTDICMDVHCACGELTHVDGEFVYFVECGHCGAVYEVNGHVELIPRKKEDIAFQEQIHKTL